MSCRTRLAAMTTTTGAAVPADELPLRERERPRTVPKDGPAAP